MTRNQAAVFDQLMGQSLGKLYKLLIVLIEIIMIERMHHLLERHKVLTTRC